MDAGSLRPDKVYRRGDQVYSLFEEPSRQWLVYEGRIFLGVVLEADGDDDVSHYAFRRAGHMRPDDRFFDGWRAAVEALVADL